jgi:8-oxo-dGTP diphosphatase
MNPAGGSRFQTNYSQSQSLMLVGESTYPFPHHPRFSQKSWAFVCREWEGESTESDELPPEWHLLADIPLHRMWDDAEHWLPDALAGHFVRDFHLRGGCSDSGVWLPAG